MTNRRKAYEKARNVARNSRTKAEKESKKRYQSASHAGISTGQRLMSAAKRFKYKLGRMLNRSKYRKPDQGRQEKARRVLHNRCDDPVYQAIRWASWKTGRQALTEPGRKPVCIAAP